MPPFAGNAVELEALVQLLEWLHAGRPPAWSTSSDVSTLETLGRWLDAAGTRPGTVQGAATATKEAR